MKQCAHRGGVRDGDCVRDADVCDRAVKKALVQVITSIKIANKRIDVPRDARVDPHLISYQRYCRVHASHSSILEHPNCHLPLQ